MNEHEEAGLLVKRLKTELGLRQGQKIFFRPHWMHIELFVYGIVDPNEQEKFIVLMKKIHRDTATRKFDVTFYPPEKFEERRLDNKTITRKRILQQPLRTVRFE